MRLSTILLRSLVALSPVAALAHAQVTIFGDPAGTPHPSVQAAVDAADEGDLLVVQPGSYAGFVIDGKALTILGGPNVGISGSVTVRNLAARQVVLLERLSVVGSDSAGGGGEAGLEVDSCTGSVRVQDCTLIGGEGLGAVDEDPGGPGARVLLSQGVAFTACSLHGGPGGEVDDLFGKGYGGSGGDGLECSSSRASVFASELFGGTGGQHRTRGGDGGNGVSASGSRVFLASSTATGGDGGYAGDVIAESGGDAGNGVELQGASDGRLLDVLALPGEPGESNGPSGEPGEPVAAEIGSSVAQHAGRDLVLEAPIVVSDVAPVALEVLGEPATDVRLLRGTRSAYLEAPTGFLGVLLYRAPRLATTVLPFATIGEKRSATGEVALGALPAGRRHVLRVIEVFASAPPAGDPPRQIGAARILIQIDETLGVDCNANGINDYVDVSTGTSFDCNEDFVPDECTGPLLDCNDNGVPDPCDLAAGTSADQNGDQVPDECESPTTFYVDDDAAPGGDGSLVAPFRSIGAAVNHSATPGDEIIVMDGVYSGPNNSNIVLPAHDVTLRSENGSGACVIDLLAAPNTRAFRVGAGQTRGLRIAGFTILGGRRLTGSSGNDAGGAIFVSSGSPTISGCRFVDNHARRGGAISIFLGQPLIEDCSFELNQATAGGSALGGGALEASDLVVRRCSFVSNAGGRGGAIEMRAGLVSHSSFLSNAAVSAIGGAINVKNGSIDNCLIAGNTALRGGGIHTASSPGDAVTISHCTLVGNEATVEGGGLKLFGQPLVVNSILFDNVAPSGNEVIVGSVVATVRYCNVAGGQAGVVVLNGSLDWGPGNIDLDPLFVDPDGVDDVASTFSDNDYRLGSGSPSIDAGANFLIAFDGTDVDGDGLTSERVPRDLGGDTRRRDDPAAPDVGAGGSVITDMGCFERTP